MGRVSKKRATELAERTAHIPQIPEKFHEWIDKELYRTDNFIYYRRKGSWADFHCSACGEDYRMRIKRRESFEGMFEQVIAPPKHNMPCRCENCGVAGEYKASGRIKDSSVYGIRKKCYVGQKYKEGVVVRYFGIEKIIGKLCGQKYIVKEIARNFFLPGKKVQKDYQPEDFLGEIKWHDHNVGGLWNISQGEGRIYPESFKELKGTVFEYTGLREYEKRRGSAKMGAYLEAYENYPYLEMFEKAGLYGIVDLLAGGYEGKEIIKDWEAERPADVLGIWSERIRMLVNAAGSVNLLKVLQLERKRGEHWTEELCRIICDLHPDLVLLGEIALKYMTVRKFLNRVERYAGIRYEEGLCGRAVNRLRAVAGTYLDYLQMREARGYDLNNTVFAYPAVLDAAHERMVEETNEERSRMRKKQMEENYPEIRKRYEELYRYYYHVAGNFIIRPACSAEEMIMEGRILHHCVGTETYLRKHDEGQSVILLLRHTDTPDVPYITVEMQKTRILQWYGAYDRKPDKEEVEEWLDEYVRCLKRADMDRTEIIIRAAG